MVDLHKRNYEGGWIIYYAEKSFQIKKLSRKKILSSFNFSVLDDLLTKYISSSVLSTSISTGTETLKGIIGKKYPTAEIKTESSDKESNCSDIMQDSLFPKGISNQVRTQKINQVFSKDINRKTKITRKTINLHAAQIENMIEPQEKKNKFKDETSIG